MQGSEDDPLLEKHAAYQRVYYRGSARHSRIEPVDTPYVRRHFDRARMRLGLGAGQRVLEVGAGLGRFTRLLLEESVSVTACDVSPELTNRLRASVPDPRLDVVECDLRDLPLRVGSARFDVAVGFFVLHHLDDLDAAFEALARVVAPGGRIAFCEPNGRNPAYYAQILLSRTMTWRGDGGLRRMVESRVLPAMSRHGFEDLAVDRYGVLPPELANTGLGQRIEARVDRRGPPRGLHAFHVFSGRRSEDLALGASRDGASR